jgi:hypothetical protein
LEQNKEIKEKLSSTKIIFNVTENIKKLGISEFFLHKRDFLIRWSNERNSCIDFNFKSSSLSQNIKLIERTLKKEVKSKNIDDETIENGIKDIEDQIIKKRDEIYNLNKTKTFENNSVDNGFKSKFLNDVSILRNQFEKLSNPYKEWQNQVNEKYKNLENTVNRIYPNTWSIIQFIIAVKTILNIEGNKLPFLGILIAIPSSLKTTFMNYFRIYDHTFYSDSFTPNSLISHNSALTEEQLKNVDMIPKMKDKLVLTPELAPLFTAKDEDLQKVLGLITRLLDGDGLESDSGAHGHRGYPQTMFSWIGAVVEIPPKVWKMLSQLGFKIYFFRPNLSKKSEDELVTIALDSKISEKNQEIKDALLEYLKVFDAAPIISDVTRLDENGIVNVKWNDETTTNTEQYRAIKYIAKIAILLASLRGDVCIYQTKSRQYTKQQECNETYEQEISYQTEQLDYETDSVIIEDPSRATIQLRNLALANAIAQGRNYIKIEDVKLIVNVALSTTRITRTKVFELLKEKGNLTTSKIVKELNISEPTARKTMREFQALGIATISSTSGYANSELTLVLNNKFRWFLSEEFQKLKDEKKLTTISCQPNIEFRRMYLPTIAKTLTNSYCAAQKTSNSNCHTLKENLLPETDKKNNDNQLLDEYDNNKAKNSKLLSIKSDNDITCTNKEITCNYISNSTSNNFVYNNNDKIENYKEYEDTNNNSKDTRLDQISIKENNITDYYNDLNLQKNSMPLGPKNFQDVTVSHQKYPMESTNILKNVIDDILKIIRDENRSISIGYALQLACQRSQIVRDYLRNEKKLTQRDSRKIQNLFVEINRHPNIKVEKRKPELVVRWDWK